jgi:fused signal recognition particle receptor
MGRITDSMQTMSGNTESRGFFSRLRERLGRGTARVSEGLRGLFRGRQIDAQLLEDLEARLIGADVGAELTQTLLKDLRARLARQELANVDALLDALRDDLTAILKPCEQPLHIEAAHKPYVVMVVGVNGSGKTTSIGKLATRLAGEGRSVMLAAGDTFRAAAAEQLQIWAERSGAQIYLQPAGSDPGSVVFDALQQAKARGIDVLLADTAGRLHSQSHLMEELKKIKRVISRVDPTAPHEVLLILDANQGQNALAQALAFKEAVGVTGLVLTKLDGTARGGIAVAIARRLGLPIRFIGIGEQSGDFGPFDATQFASALVGDSHTGSETP